MVVPMLVDLYYVNADWKVFFFCAFVTAYFGGTMIFTTSTKSMDLTPKSGFLMIFCCWIFLSIFSALPFWLSELDISFCDAFFESVSGLTTTGSTVLVGLDTMPKGLLIWRAILQWLGGVGIIIMAFSVLPFLKVGGMQLFKTELSESEKVIPRSADFAKSIGGIYFFLTVTCAFFYHQTGINSFDSIALAMTTLSTGGFANTDASFSNYTSYGPLIVASIFMTCSAIPYILYLKVLHGNTTAIFKDPQARLLLKILAVAITLIALFLVYNKGYDPDWSFVHSMFNTISLMTGTGYASADYGIWGTFPIVILFFLMAMGASAGSTSCGIKLFRFQVLAAMVLSQIKKLLYPNGVFIPYYAGKPISDETSASVMSFVSLYILCFVLLAIALAFTGLDFVTALSGAMTAISNVGPGFGDIIGPSGNFKPLSDASKWILATGMLLGRLELFAILVLISPHFWRR